MTRKGNVIPRNFDFLLVRKMGTKQKFKVTKDEVNGYLGVEIGTGKRYSMFLSHLRNPDIYELLAVAKI